jgi:hypothetical protein
MSLSFADICWAVMAISLFLIFLFGTNVAG